MAALTKDQIAARRLGIGGSDAAKIMGTDEDWYALWLDKTGRKEPDTILAPWDAALRHHCESLILDWYAVEFDRPISRRAELVISGDYPMLRCNLDGADMAIPKVIDAKMLNLFTPDAVQWCKSHYAWQIMHQMICCTVPNGALYVSLGMKKPFLIEFEYDEFTANEYIDRCRRFWAYVVEDREPAGAPAPIAPPTPIELMRVVDMQGSNQWAALADDWLTNEPAAKKFDKAVKGLKGLIKADVREASGHGLIASRDGRGVTIKRS